MNDDTPDPDRPGIARTREPPYAERSVELRRSKKKTGEHSATEVEHAVKALERSGSLKTYAAVAGLLFGGGGVGHSVWRSNDEDDHHRVVALQLKHDEEARAAMARDIEKLQQKLEDAQLELAVCCDQRDRRRP